MRTITNRIILIIGVTASCALAEDTQWNIRTTEEWQQAEKESTGLIYEEGCATPTNAVASYSSVVKTFKTKRSPQSMVIKQSPVWQNWNTIANIGPENLKDAPVLLSMGPDNYWIFGRYGPIEQEGFAPEKAELAGFDMPLTTTPLPHQFNAPGGLKEGLGGYHAWQSRDMVNWVHHGPVTEKFSRWVTTAEQVDGAVYIYYDYPNDQDPHLYIDEDLTDGIPGKDMGLAFKDPSDGSDCAIIRDLQGRFHVIYEDWSPINARKHSWDSPLAGHAVSADGTGDFKILAPAVDHRTKPTGEVAEYLHPHWAKEHPDWDSNVARYNVHEPEQNAYGDWAAISIGSQHYLFSDYHPANAHIRLAWFTSSSMDGPFEFCGELGQGHPDPDIIFAEGKFYLATQMDPDFVSPGPWVEQVEVRAGVDTNGDGVIDQWTGWQEVKEQYDVIPGFSKQVQCTPAALDLCELPSGLGFAFECRIKDITDNASKPMLDSITISFDSKE